MIDFRCPQCDNHVRIDVEDQLYSGDDGFDRAEPTPVEAWCCTAHPRPVRMTLLPQGTEPPAARARTA